MRQELVTGDALTVLAGVGTETIDCCVTSPPYWALRDYGCAGQIGFEITPTEWCAKLTEVFREVRRVLKRSGVLWLNVGDVYATGAGHFRKAGGGEEGERWADKGGMLTRPNRLPVPGLKRKDLVGLPWMLAFALRDDGWYLRSDVIWQKPNAKPESAQDRPTRSHEYLFLLSRSEDYYYDRLAIVEPQVESERLRRLREAAAGRQSVYMLKRDQLRTQAPAGASGCFRSSAARQALALSGVRNRRTVWTIATRKASGTHFATYPEDLVRPCILAGTSEFGVCGACGEPWRRIVERPAAGDLHSDQGLKELGVCRLRDRKIAAGRTLGWERGCDCRLWEEPATATVLDPFAGTGTTLVAAKRLGRGYLGIELNPEYALMARERLQGIGVPAEGATV